MTERHASFLNEMAAEAYQNAPYLYSAGGYGAFKNLSLATFVIASRNSPELIGVIRLSDVSLRNRVAFVELHVRRSCHEPQLFGEAVTLFLRYAFANWDLRKIYAKSSRCAMRSLPHQVLRLFESEGVLRQHYIHNNVTIDDEIYAFHISRLAELIDDE